MKMRGSPLNQVTTCLNSLIKFGSSKYNIKHDLIKSGITKSSDIAKHTGIYSENTMKNYINAGTLAFKYIRDEFGVKDITQITEEHIKSYLNYRVSEVDYHTLKIDMAALNKLEIAINTFAGSVVNIHSAVEEFRQEIKQDYDYTHKEKEGRAFAEPKEVINNMKMDTHKLAAEMQLEYGFRINEVAKIDLNKQLNNNILTVQAKGGQFIRKELSKEHITKLHNLSSNGIFNINKISYGAEIKNACKAVNEQYTGSHAFRHNYGQNRFQAYIDVGYKYNQALRLTAEDMGHHREDITMTYLR